ncbi:hypothetical protein PV08_02266 [Exophiala spinifera]|uniref:Major facilitator superfamily (MFS) profile domain-containing protein n=1 Tax=Exophiala spinifera TaxID=91928 RepID=A0A0D1Z1Z3_9EURO|nr:uncharacterized protein PV08_02266 [Exophiala spinifera]KIW21686.1 hypothetical protein PV08_02266 [Exophiala spinifera]
MGSYNADHDEIETRPQREDGGPSAHKIGEEVLDARIHDDHGDAHKAALEDADADGHVAASTWAAVFFLGFTFIPALSFTLNSFVPVASVVALQLQDNLHNLNWISGGFSLGGSVAFAIAGQLSDYLGRKDIILGGQTFLLVGHLVGATAQTLDQVIAAMVLLGLGTGATFVTYAGISEILPHKWRAFGLATTEVFLMALGTFGPLTGRGLTQNVTWRWLFILGDITAVIAMAGTLIFYHPPSQVFQDRTKLQVLGELDYFGLFLYTAGVTLFLLGIGWATQPYAWTSAAVLAPLLIGIVLFLAAFAWSFSGRPGRPLLPLRLFKQWRAYTIIAIIGFTSGLAHIALVTFVPQQIAYVFTSDPILAGWYNVPVGFGACIGGVLLGPLIPRIKHVPLQFLAANAIQAVSCGLLAIVTPRRIAGGIVIQAISNLPFTWIIVLSYTSVGLHVPQRELGLAYGLLGAIRYLGGAVSSTIFNTILSAKVGHYLPTRVASAVVPLGYPVKDIEKLIQALSSHVPARLAAFPPDVVAAAADAMRWGYSDAFNWIWYAAIPFFVVACSISPFVLDPSPYFTNHTAVASTDESIVSRLTRNRRKAERSLDIEKEVRVEQRE